MLYEKKLKVSYKNITIFFYIEKRMIKVFTIFYYENI